MKKEDVDMSAEKGSIKYQQSLEFLKEMYEVLNPI